MNLTKLDTNPYQNLWGHFAFWLFDVTFLFYATSMYFIRRVILSWIKSKSSWSTKWKTMGVLHIDNKRMPIIQETPVSPFSEWCKIWHIMAITNSTWFYMHLIVHLYRYSFIPVINCNTYKTGYYQLIVDEPIFENSCSYDAVEKVMYFYDTRTYTLHDACKTITLFNCKENRCRN